MWDQIYKQSIQCDVYFIFVVAINSDGAIRNDNHSAIQKQW